MFTIKECFDGERAGALCQRFGAEYKEGDRVFVFDEDGPRAVGVLRLQRGKVLVYGVFGDISDAYRDVTVRALLNVCARLQPITVRVESTSAYYKQFGFTEKDGGMEVQSTDIRFH